MKSMIYFQLMLCSKISTHRYRVFHRHPEYLTKTTYFPDLPEENKTGILNNTFKFTCVRNPFERLVVKKYFQNDMESLQGLHNIHQYSEIISKGSHLTKISPQNVINMQNLYFMYEQPPKIAVVCQNSYITFSQQIIISLER